jgi:hypothetical protein
VTGEAICKEVQGDPGKALVEFSKVKDQKVEAEARLSIPEAKARVVLREEHRVPVKIQVMPVKVVVKSEEKTKVKEEDRGMLIVVVPVEGQNPAKEVVEHHVAVAAKEAAAEGKPSNDSIRFKKRG